MGNFRRAFVNTNRWFLTCVNQPDFVKVLGKVTLATKMAQAKAPQKKETQQKKQEDNQQKKQVDLPAMAWLYPIAGYVPDNKNRTKKAKGDIRKALSILNEHLKTRTFLVSERVTLADIVVALSLKNLYTTVLDPNFRRA